MRHIVLTRIDDRLIHGEVITGWLGPDSAWLGVATAVVAGAALVSVVVARQPWAVKERLAPEQPFMSTRGPAPMP